MWLGMTTNASNVTSGRITAVRNHSSCAIRPASFNRISPFTTWPNRHSRPCAMMVMKQAPAWT
jgi:hypothetical protein